jgi:hypothetical protein
MTDKRKGAYVLAASGLTAKITTTGLRETWDEVKEESGATYAAASHICGLYFDRTGTVSFSDYVELYTDGDFFEIAPNAVLAIENNNGATIGWEDENGDTYMLVFHLGTPDLSKPPQLIARSLSEWPGPVVDAQ